ncbi:MAG: DUF1080 domain-containing protein [Verrucomicrobia bacterium]|nr:DUF1080 domain-containing protein [Verrucomicrobiota bacterium]MCF7707596.1 DUF1080 domain-containing protein [Verrucomicrobiota bacterium]
MRRAITAVILFICVFCLTAAEQKFDFSEVSEGELPSDFESKVTGEGEPAEWRIIREEVESAFESLTGMSPVVTYQKVLVPASGQKLDEHFPLLVYEAEEFGDFTYTCKVKIVEGDMERMAGIAFRIRDSRNYYVFRISAAGNTVYFYKFVDGMRSKPIGKNIEIETDKWYKLTVKCQGNQIRCFLDDEEVIPEMTDTSFLYGKIGFWTKSDAVAYFLEPELDFKPRVIFAQKLINKTLKEFDRLRGISIFTISNQSADPEIIASSDQEKVGETGSRVEKDVISNGHIYTGKDAGKVIVTMPLHDRNGVPMAAVRIEMETFFGQTDQNAISRAMPIVKGMDEQALGLESLMN